MKVIEPVEIIVEDPNHPKEEFSPPHPWLRFLARFFDYSLFFLLLLFTRKWFHGQLPFGRYETFIPFEYFVWISIEALFLSTWGTTAGKFFLKIQLKAGRKNRLDFMTALRRSFSVWFRGLGMGIYGINFFCCWIAYNKLKLFRITSWDRDDHIQVLHRPVEKWRIYFAVFVAAVGLLYYYREKNLEIYRAHAIEQTGSVIRSVDESASSQIVSARLHFSA